MSSYDDIPDFGFLYDNVPLYQSRPDVAFYVAEARRAQGRALELGSGTGRVLLPIARAGIDVTGIDASRKMLDRCHATLRGEDASVRSRVQLYEADMRDFDLGRTFALVIAPFRVMQHQDLLSSSRSFASLTIHGAQRCYGATRRIPALRFATTPAMHRHMPVQPKRSILFVWHTGEEAGLTGARWFTANFPVPKDSIVAQLNMDMIGRGRADDIPGGAPDFLGGVGSGFISNDLGEAVRSVNARQPKPLQLDYRFDSDVTRTLGSAYNNIYRRSDHYMYAQIGTANRGKRPSIDTPTP